MERRIIEGIEACRPGTDDVRAADMSDVAHAVESDPQAKLIYERVQRCDAAIGNVMDKLPVPAGLAERILARLHANPPVGNDTFSRGIDGALSAAQSPATGEVNLTRTAAETDRTADFRRWAGSRRRYLAIGGTIAGAILVAALIANLPSRNHDSLETLVDDWQQDLSGSWQKMAQAPHAFAFSPAVTATPIGWRSLKGVRGVAYRLATVGAPTATLFVVRLAVAGAPAAPPIRPQWTTGGKAIGYWQTGGFAYVLVVEGSERNYRSFISTSPMPLA